MKRGAAVLLLLLLLILAFVFHRAPREETPRKPPPPAPVVEAIPPELRPGIDVAAVSTAAPAPRPAPAPAPPQLPQAPPPVGIARTAILRGTVTIVGPVPPRKRIKMDADPQCQTLHPVGTLLTDAIVADPEGRLRWAFVYVAKGINNQPPAGLLPPALLDQVGCRYEPHVLGVQVGQPLNIYNNDPLLHNVHGFPFENLQFNFGLPTRGNFKTITFDAPEIMLPVRCDIHPWMRAYVGVLDHPYFCVTSDAGSYSIPQLPAGRYTVKVWHEEYATVTREVDVPVGGDVRLDFFMDARKR
jgi:hypothetical protein